MKSCPFCQAQMNDEQHTCTDCGRAVEDATPGSGETVHVGQSWKDRIATDHGVRRIFR